MTILDIITYPDPRLLSPSETVTDFGEDTQQLIEDMAETMFDAPGAGLAAIQVAVPKRIIVVNATPSRESEKEPEPEPAFYALINPEITDKSGVYISEDEGCLSVPELRANVKRASWVKVTAQDRSGKSFTMEAQDYKAVVLQHEIDHLNGRLFFEHLTTLKRNLYKKKMKKRMKGQ